MNKNRGIGKCGYILMQQVIKFACSTGCDKEGNEKKRKKNMVVGCLNSTEETTMETWEPMKTLD